MPAFVVVLAVLVLVQRERVGAELVVVDAEFSLVAQFEKGAAHALLRGISLNHAKGQRRRLKHLHSLPSAHNGDKDEQHLVLIKMDRVVTLLA